MDHNGPLLTAIGRSDDRSTPLQIYGSPTLTDAT
jgi:hypothetical protein